MSFLAETFFMESTSDNVKELNIIMEQANIDFMKIDQMFTIVESQREINMKASELKVVAESGTMEDLEMLYEAANAEADGKKKGIISSAISAIQNFFGRILDFINEKILRREVPGKVRVSKDTLDKCDAIDKADGEVRGAIAKLKSGQIPDVAKVLAAIAAIGAVAGGGYVIITKTDLKSRINNLKQKITNIKGDTAKLENDKNSEKADKSFWSIFKKFGDAVMNVIKSLERAIFGEKPADEEEDESPTSAEHGTLSEADVKQFMQDNPGASYKDAQTALTASKSKNNGAPKHGTIDEKAVRDYMKSNPNVSYDDAIKALSGKSNVKESAYDDTEDIFGADYMYESAMSELEQMIDEL